MTQVSLSDEIVEFLHRYAADTTNLPQVINIAFSGERKPEAWHFRTTNKQVGRGFNKAAKVTVMLPLKSWRTLMKKNKIKLWQQALLDGQINMHGNAQSIQAISDLFQDGKNSKQHTAVDPTTIV